MKPRKQNRPIITCACGCGRKGHHAARGLIDRCYHRAKTDRRLLESFPARIPRKFLRPRQRNWRHCPKCGDRIATTEYGEGRRCTACTPPPRVLPKGCTPYKGGRIQVVIWFGRKYLYLGLFRMGEVAVAGRVYQAAAAARATGADAAAIKYAAYLARQIWTAT